MLVLARRQLVCRQINPYSRLPTSWLQRTTDTGERNAKTWLTGMNITRQHCYSVPTFLAT